LGTAAMAAGRTRERTYLGARYARLFPELLVCHERREGPDHVGEFLDAVLCER
jgi:hypothetical protein